MDHFPAEIMVLFRLHHEARDRSRRRQPRSRRGLQLFAERRRGGPARLTSPADHTAKVVTATNPVLGTDHPDPHVLRVVDKAGTVRYYLTSTVGTSDIPIYTSTDLVHWSVKSQAFGGLTAKGDGALEINGAYFCNIWAPQIVETNGSYLLSFTAQRFDTPPKTCPDYNEDSGVYLASAASPEGPYATADHPWEPLVGGGQISSCSSTIKDEIPHSPDVAFHDCDGGQCDQIMRLDSDVFHDSKDGSYWLSYAWYTNDGPLTDWEQTNFGEHVSVTQLDSDDPWSVVCKESVPQVFIANPHDDATTTRLAASCPRCGEMLAMDRQRGGSQFIRSGFDWGVNEGPNLFRHGDYVYAMISGSVWDSAYYSVFWIAAPTVPELAYSNAKRLVGRFLVPSEDQIVRARHLHARPRWRDAVLRPPPPRSHEVSRHRRLLTRRLREPHHLRRSRRRAGPGVHQRALPRRGPVGLRDGARDFEVAAAGARRPSQMTDMKRQRALHVAGIERVDRVHQAEDVARRDVLAHGAGLATALEDGVEHHVQILLRADHAVAVGDLLGAERVDEVLLHGELRAETLHEGDEARGRDRPSRSPARARGRDARSGR